MRPRCRSRRPTRCKLKDPGAFRYIGKGNVALVDLFDITAGTAIYGQDVRLPGMKYAVVARPPVVGGKVVSFDATETMKVPGVEKVVQLDATPAPAKFNPLGGVAVIAKNTWAAIKGREALKIVWDDGPNKAYNSKAYRAQARGAGAQARQDRAQRRRCRCGAEVGGAGDHRGILRAASRPCHDGAAGRGGAPRGRQVERVGAGAEPGRRARRHRQGARHQAGGDGGQLHAARRRLRPQVEMRLRDRGGVAVARARRRARQGGVDARGRYPPRLLPHRDGRSLRGGPRRQQQGGGVAASQRGADHPVDLRAGPEASVRHRARHGLGRHAVQRAEHPHGERRGAEPHAHRLVPLGQQRDARLVDPVVRRPRSRPRSARTRRTSCSS